MEIVDQLWAKVRRAREHADETERIVSEFIPDGIRYELHGDHRTATYEVRLRQVVPPPVDLALAYADELGNLRAVLDHAIWHLAGDQAHKFTAFPMTMKEADWGSARGSPLRGVSKPCQRIIREFQPFQYENTIGAEKHPGRVLDKLNNRNKHHLLIGLGVSQIDFRVGVRYSRTPRMDDLIIKDPVPTEGTSLEDGAVVMKLRLISKTKDLFITDISPEVESNVGFGPRHDLKVIPFPNLAIYVGTVIAALEPALRAHPSDP